MLQRRNVAKSSRKLVTISRWVNWHSVGQDASKLKLGNCNNFVFSCTYICIYEHFFDIVWYFLCGKLAKPCHCIRIAKSQSAKHGKYYQQTPSHFINTAVFSHRCPLRHPAPWSGHWYAGIYRRTFDPGPCNPTTHLWLRAAGYYLQSIECQMDVPSFNSSEKALTITIYDCVLRFRSK